MNSIFGFNFNIRDYMINDLWIKIIFSNSGKGLVLYFLLSIYLFTACSSLTTFINDPENIKWADEIREFQVLDSTETYGDDAILFAGSSSIRLWNSINEDMQPYSVIQRGYGGAKLSDFAYFTKDIIYPHEFNALVLFVANDISGSEKDKTPKIVAELFEYIVSIVRNKYPSTPIFWIEITPTLSRWNVLDKIEKANNLIKQYCAVSENLYFIETKKIFLNNDGVPDSTLFINDQLHLNDGGYAVWTEIIKNELNTVLK